MKDDKEGQAERKPFSTCLEGSPCAEMMQKLMGGQGCGSFCQEMMESMTKDRRKAEEKPQESKKEEDRERQE